MFSRIHLPGFESSPAICWLCVCVCVNGKAISSSDVKAWSLQGAQAEGKIMSQQEPATETEFCRMNWNVCPFLLPLNWVITGCSAESRAIHHRGEYTAGLGVRTAEGGIEGKVDTLQNSCCFVPMLWISRLVTTSRSHRMNAASLLPSRTSQESSLWLTLTGNTQERESWEM